MAVHIQLVRLGMEDANQAYLKVFRIRVEIGAETVGLEDDDRIFVYRRLPPDPYTGEEFDEFQTVASVVDLSQFPPEEPGEASPFFRLNYVELDFRSSIRVEEFWELIQREVCVLVEALERAPLLREQETTWCPSPPENSESESESASA